MKESNNGVIWTGQKEWEPWDGSNRCPNCGGDEIECNTQLVLTSYPPQSQLRCKKCGHIFSSGFGDSRHKALDDALWQHDQSILGIPQVGDWPPGPTVTDPMPSLDGWKPFPTPNTTGVYGWICPKCGRALAPHLQSCPYCSGPTHIKDVQEWLDEQPTVNLYEWISVKDRLPEQFGKYLVVCKGICISQIRLWEGTWDSFAEITHWMPLPTPPTEKENKNESN